MKLNISTIISRLGLLSLSTAMLVGCSDDIEVPYDGSDNGTITLVAKCGDMLPQFIDPTDVGSRAGGPKDEDEKRINTLHVFFFDGEADPSTHENRLLTSTELGFDAYQRITTNVMSVPSLKDAFDGDFSGKEILVCALANLSNGTKFKTAYSPDGDMKGVKISDTPDETEPYVYDEITCLQDLQNWVYCPILRSEEGTAVSDLPKAGMPMIGEKRISSADYQSNKNILIPMKAMMARVDVNVKLDPENESSTGLPRMTITEYGVRNMPKRVPYVARTCGTKQNPDTTVQPIEPEFTQSVNITIDKNSDVVRFHYYTYENVRQPNWEAKRTDGSNAYNDNYTEINYPINNPTTMQKQRWKPTIAQKGTASAVVLKANYTTHQNLNYKAQFTIYMGENTTDNFEVHRNRQYVNNISIRGLDYVRNSDDGVYTFDGRVNVVSDNPVYISVVNERKVDSHASVLPMDFFFLIEPKEGELEPDSYVDVSLIDPSTGVAPDWIRMEKINAETMENGGINLDPDTYIQGMVDQAGNREAFSAGTGARKYFTYNLVNDILKDNTSLTISRRTDHSRTRIYFYIDENIPEVKPAGDENIPDRKAIVYITYRNNTNGDRRERTIEIEQRGMLRVKGTSNERNIDYFIEYYEEYMAHSDPLDKHEMPGELYQGLPWVNRLDGQNTFPTSAAYRTWLRQKNYYTGSILVSEWTVGGRYRSYHIYGERDGYWMTDFMINGRESARPMSDVKTYNRTKEETPPTAFHYCYGKNKRNSNGDVHKEGKKGYWFLPGITDLELALEKYYTNFPEFKENFYWSSSSAKSQGSILGAFRDECEGTNQARATNIKADGTHESSGDDSNTHPNNPGRMDRTKINRIRAGYIYLE